MAQERDVKTAAWKRIAELVERRREAMTELSDRLWELAETKFEEFESAGLLAERLEQQGFTVAFGIGGLPTAFMASYGSGWPVIAILGEYDALPGMSQTAGAVIREPLKPGGSGHGCGHHLLGTGSLAAAVALKEYMAEAGLPGTIRYYGCPAEEGGSGKTFLVREGAFADVDVALTWHPGYGNAVVSQTSSANYQVRYRFQGRSSHAAASPHTGRSALDAVELMNVGANYLREHVPREAQFHYAITDTGGFSPNVVQAIAEVVYLIRAPEVRQVEEIYARINDIAKGAALMTGTEVQIGFEKACSNLIPNVTVERIMQRCFEALGVPAFTEVERRYARAILETLRPEAKPGTDGGLKVDSQPEAAPRTDSPQVAGQIGDTRPEAGPKTDSRQEAGQIGDSRPEAGPRTDSPQETAQKNDPRPEVGAVTDPEAGPEMNPEPKYAPDQAALPETLDPYRPVTGRMLGSTDVADVSWVVPTAQLETVCFAADTPFHSWQMVAQGKTAAAHKGMLHAAKVLAATAAELLKDPSVLEEAKRELRSRGGLEGYICPIPAHVLPPVKAHPGNRQLP
ncbi:amidohydrolase [Paenibacillus macerans]|uniref:amidohydrolase n=1 Tax=Paenibacillus macerans TaxID=44252 RepID=UPI00203B7327|nr:amidohydrolase [Paenibacillus macerans]MCM3702398.1 amidohydrolase [Paenibacillus macerans]